MSFCYRKINTILKYICISAQGNKLHVAVTVAICDHTHTKGLFLNPKQYCLMKHSSSAFKDSKMVPIECVCVCVCIYIHTYVYVHMYVYIYLHRMSVYINQTHSFLNK